MRISRSTTTLCHCFYAAIAAVLAVDSGLALAMKFHITPGTSPGSFRDSPDGPRWAQMAPDGPRIQQPGCSSILWTCDLPVMMVDGHCHDDTSFQARGIVRSPRSRTLFSIKESKVKPQSPASQNPKPQTLNPKPKTPKLEKATNA